MAMFNPMRELDAMQREMDRAFRQMGLSGFPDGRLAFLPGRAARQYPLVNLHDDGNNFYLEALAPGIEPDKLDITVAGNTVTISGEKPGLKDVPPERIHRNERAAGRFVRTFELPAPVDADKIGAQYRHGMLLLTMPRSEDARPRRISVQAA